jgi:hypothetical protein
MVSYLQLLTISGIKNDYYVAVALVYTGQFEFMTKKFYWCLSNDFSFSEMPGLNDAHRAFVDRDNSFFTGEPNKKLIQPKEGEEAQEEAPPEKEEEEGEEGAAKDNQSDISEPEEIKIPSKDLTEIDRLCFVVCAIENDCQIAPVGAFKMTA